MSEKLENRFFILKPKPDIKQLQHVLDALEASPSCDAETIDELKADIERRIIKAEASRHAIYAYAHYIEFRTRTASNIIGLKAMARSLQEWMNAIESADALCG